MKVDLSQYDNTWYDPGRRSVQRLFWFCTNALLFQNPLNPFSSLKITILKVFGASIGIGVVIKPGVNIKYPWNVKIGDYSWIGEKVWLDSLAPIVIGSNVCVSQGVYVCTGNHDWSDPAFGLITKPIVIEDGAWVGAQATLLPGIIVGSHSVVTAGSVVTKNTESKIIYSGNPAAAVRARVLEPDKISKKRDK